MSDRAAIVGLEWQSKLILLLDAVDFPVPEQADKRRGDHRKRRGSDHEVGRPHFHPDIRRQCAL